VLKVNINTEKKPRKYFEILKVRIDSTKPAELLREIARSYAEFKKGTPRKIVIFTPNPEQIVLAQNDQDFLQALNSADFCLPDGVGILFAKKFLELPKEKFFLKKVPLYLLQGLGVCASLFFDRDWLFAETAPIRGRDFFLKILEFANDKSLKVFLLGDEKSSAQKAMAKLVKIFPKIKFFSMKGPLLKTDGFPKDIFQKRWEKKIVERVSEVKPDFVFVGFGAPKQEKWIVRMRKRLPFFAIMGVGGTFNYISGKAPLPPRFVSDYGFEWLWRLTTGSQKFERIKKAIFDFPLSVFVYKLNLEEAKKDS